MLTERFHYLILGVILLYFFPLILLLFNFDFNFLEYHQPITSGIIFSLVCAITIPIASLIIASKLFKFQSNLIIILLIPFLLGSVSTAFIFKAVFMDLEGLKLVFFENRMFSYFITYVIFFWQFGSLFVFLFYINGINLKKDTILYLQSFHSESSLINKDYIFKESKPLLLFLTFLTFIYSLHESAISSIVINASSGTNNELITNSLYKSFKANINVSVDYAINNVYWKSLILLFISVIIIYLLSLVITKFYDILVKKDYTQSLFHVFNALGALSSKLILFFIVFILILPVVYPFIAIPLQFNSDVLIALFFPFVLTILTALITSLISIFISVWLRLKKNRILESFNTVSLKYFNALFVIMLIPSILILINGFKWMSLINIQGDVIIYFMWITGHIIFTTPVLVCFSLLTFMQIKATEIEYLSASNQTFRESMFFNFFGKFKKEFFLTFLMAISIIWNEGTVNRVFSDTVPSFVSLLLSSLTGKGANYSIALWSYLISVSVAVLCLFVLITSSLKNKSNAKQ